MGLSRPRWYPLPPHLHFTTFFFFLSLPPTINITISRISLQTKQSPHHFTFTPSSLPLSLWTIQNPKLKHTTKNKKINLHFFMATLTHSASASAPPQFYLDEKWRFSKKEGSSRSRSSTTSTTTTTFSQRRCSFTRKCARLVKEQRARFYIVRRCVIMLICWRDYSDS